MRFWLTSLIVVAVAVPGMAAAELDFEGNVIGSGPGTWDTPGDPCGQCSAPYSLKGVDFKGNDLWGITSAGLLYHFVNCNVVETVQT